jgi:response regulator RpfG family c-di-GMP phosphodiesterase
MKQITAKDVLVLIQRTVNSVDHRLENHGEQVAYMSWVMFWMMGYRESDLLRLTALAMMHDIGAYKPDEQRRLTEIEVFNPHEHCVYGYLFLREFSPDPALAPVILYHHWKWNHRDRLIAGMPIPKEASVIHLVDRVSVLFAQAGRDLKPAVLKFFPLQRDSWFDPELVDQLLRLTAETDFVDKLVNGDYLTDVYQLLDGAPVSDEELLEYMQLLSNVIDFRGHHTACHSRQVQAVAGELCEMTGITDPEERRKCELAALVQGVGRMSVPVDAFAMKGVVRSGDEQLAIISKTRQATADILAGGGFRNLSEAVADGGAGMVPSGKEIVVVADAFVSLIEGHMDSENAVHLLKRMMIDGHLGEKSYAVLAANHHRLCDRMASAQHGVSQQYENIHAEYKQLIQEMRQSAL